jgi:hypothetical protein
MEEFILHVIYFKLLNYRSVIMSVYSFFFSMSMSSVSMDDDEENKVGIGCS